MTPCIDSHLHLWSPQIMEYPWLEDLPQLQKDFTLDNYYQATKGLNISGGVFVQCECRPEDYKKEVEWIQSIAAKDRFIKGIVSYAPVHKGESIQEDLDFLSDFKLVKGVREQYGDNTAKIVEPDFLKGLKKLAQADLSFDICIQPHQFEYSIEMVQKSPGTRFILDHMAKPLIKEKEIELWRKYMKILSDFEQVHCKISGLLTEAPAHSTAEDLLPYIEVALECFGEDRLMYGGDWPVLTLAGDYKKWWQMVEEIFEHLGLKNSEKIYYSNAVNCYNLDV